MSDALFTYRSGDFATARRGSVAADAEFIRTKHRQGVPVSAIARMVGRNVSDVAGMCEPPPVALERPAEPPPAPPKRPSGERKGAVARPYMRHRSMPDLARLYAEETCDLRDVPLEAVIGDSCVAKIAHVRQEIYWRLSKAGYNNCEIGQFIGARDPSTVRSGIKAHVRRFWLGEP